MAPMNSPASTPKYHMRFPFLPAWANTEISIVLRRAGCIENTPDVSIVQQIWSKVFDCNTAGMICLHAEHSLLHGMI